MNQINLKPSFLQVLYLIVFSALFSLVIYTPTFVKGPVNLNEKLIFEEETIEGILLTILFIMSIIILNLYRKDVIKQKILIEKIKNEKRGVEDRLFSSEQYIGIMNVQMQEIKSIFNSVDKYPETKDDLKKAYSFFGERVIGIVNSQWVLFRIIDNNTQRTVSEHFVTRQGFLYNYPHVSNKMVLNNQPILPFSYVISSPKNLNILVFCVIPSDEISNDQRIFIQAIINEITKLFVILESSYYIKENKLLSVGSIGIVPPGSVQD
jgi:hypothetical protein